MSSLNLGITDVRWQVCSFCRTRCEQVFRGPKTTCQACGKVYTAKEALAQLRAEARNERLMRICGCGIE